MDFIPPSDRDNSSAVLMMAVLVCIVAIIVCAIIID